MKRVDPSSSSSSSSASPSNTSRMMMTTMTTLEDSFLSSSSLWKTLPEYQSMIVGDKLKLLREKEGAWHANQAKVIRSDSRIELRRPAKKFMPYLKKPRINKKCLDFLEAVEKGDLVKVKSIHAEESSLNLETRRGDKSWTPLITAVYYGHLEIVKLLINVGAEVEVVDKDFKTPLIHASENGNLNANPHLMIRTISEALAFKKRKNNKKTVCLI